MRWTFRVPRLGRLLEVGTTEQIFHDPHQRETEDYILGRMG